MLGNPAIGDTAPLTTYGPATPRLIGVEMFFIRLRTWLAVKLVWPFITLANSIIAAHEVSDSWSIVPCGWYFAMSAREAATAGLPVSLGMATEPLASRPFPCDPRALTIGGVKAAA